VKEHPEVDATGPLGLTVDQAALALQLHPKTIRGLLRSGELVGRKIGKVWRIHRSELERFLRGGRHGRDSGRTRKGK
jgi:excisionase family DNA binding protein